MFYRQAHPKVTYKGRASIEALKGRQFYCDEQQIRQAVTNIIQNALDSMEERAKSDPSLDQKLGVWMAQDGQGNMLLQDLEGMHKFVGGEISLRADI